MQPERRVLAKRWTAPGLGAFTLIEVLVVVAIIALLVAILVPSLAKAREMARRGVCSARMHNLALAVHQYSQANRGKILQCHVQNYLKPLAPGVPSRGPVVQGAIDPRMAAPGDASIPISENWRYVDWQAAAKRYYLDKETWECPNREGLFSYGGVPDKNVQGYTKAELVSRGYKVDDSGLDYDQWGIGIQYFGGIQQWQTPLGNFRSRSPLDSNARPNWALASDSNIWVDDTRWSFASQISLDRIPPHRAGGGIPAGGNVLTFDGAVAWIPFGKMLSIHAWADSGAGGRQGFWWQADLGDYGAYLARNDPSHQSVKQWKAQ